MYNYIGWGYLFLRRNPSLQLKVITLLLFIGVMAAGCWSQMRGGCFSGRPIMY